MTVLQFPERRQRGVWIDHNRRYGFKVVTADGHHVASVALERCPTEDEYGRVLVALAALLDAVDPTS